MFYLNKDTDLTPELLGKMINKFNMNVKPRLQRYKNYYDGIQGILNKSYSDPSKPCSKAVTNFCLNIANSYAGYLATPEHISYSSNDDIDEIMNVLRYNDYQSEDASFLLDALIYGVAAELMYMDEDAQVRFKLINPTTCFGVYDDSLTGDLLYFVRIYQADEWNDSSLYYVDVYGDTGLKHYKMTTEFGAPIFMSEEPNFFSQCPANIFTLPDEKSIFDCIMSQQDSYNELLNSEIDDYSAFCDAYMVITGADLLPEDVATMKANRVMVLPDGAAAQYLTKAANDTQVENTLKRIHENIYRIAQCPDFSSESFVGGVSSGVAIQYRLTGMETRAGKIEGEMKKALQRRIEIICGVASLKLGEDVFRDIKITFKRNIPEDTTATINKINALKGTVSDATLLGELDFITDVNAEIEAVKAQKQENMNIYGFGSFGSQTSDEEEEV